ncbi:MAG: hypothetical protein IT385_24945 [Deltaproteobacteria bacterium]|nr:hypothetical protein [Deltaproteobacteria bacterium]
MTHLAALASLVVLVLAPVARADVVPPPPDDCIEGTRPSTCHGGPHCRPELCPAGDTCTDGFTCQTKRVCTGELQCAGDWGGGEPPPKTKVVLGECTSSCTSCEDLRLCLPAVAPKTSGSKSGCHAAGGPAALAFVVLALGLLALAQNLPRRRAFSLLALGAMLGAVGPAAADEDAVSGWLHALARLDVDTAALADADVVFVADAEPGVLPDGRVQLPRAWLAAPDDPATLARLGHLARHLTLGLPAIDPAACAAWRLHMLALELDGLAVEGRVADALGAPLSADALAAEVALRVDQYRARCEAAR